MLRFLLHLFRLALCLGAVAAGVWLGELQTSSPPTASPPRPSATSSRRPLAVASRRPPASPSRRPVAPPPIAAPDAPPPLFPEAAEEARYAALDARAAKAPPEVTRSIPALAAWLIAPTRSEREKARAIFAWIGHNVRYTAGIDPENPPQQSADDVLAQRTAICAGYAKLFKALADSAGLEAEVVTGFARTPSTGDGPYGRADLHAWNAVRIDGRWQLVDPTWGAGAYVDGQFDARFEPFWFLTPPSMFVYTHLPSEPTWQLLARPLDETSQRRLPMLTAAAWSLGLHFEPATALLASPDGTAVVRFSAPDDVRFRAMLRPASTPRGTKEASPPGSVLDRRLGGRCETRVACPAAGRWRLDVYAGSAADEKRELNLAGTWIVEAGRGADALVANMGNVLPRGAWIAPAERSLDARRTQHFEVHVPYSKGAFVKVGETITRLEGTWPDFRGDVDVAPGTVQVCADVEEGRYVIVAEYEAR